MEFQYYLVSLPEDVLAVVGIRISEATLDIRCVIKLSESSLEKHPYFLGSGGNPHFLPNVGLNEQEWQAVEDFLKDFSLSD